MSQAGLRERKNARTRAAIERAALELALDQGFERTTVDQIAERADISPRTVFGRYGTKEAIVFAGADNDAAGFERWLDEGDGDLLERVGAYFRWSIKRGAEDELSLLRLRAMLSDPYLRGVLHGRLDAREHVIAERLSHELGTHQDDVGARTIAAGVTGLLLAIGDRVFADPNGADPAADLDRGLAVLRAGLDQLRESPPR